MLYVMYELHVLCVVNVLYALYMVSVMYVLTVLCDVLIVCVGRAHVCCMCFSISYELYDLDVLYNSCVVSVGKAVWIVCAVCVV